MKVGILGSGVVGQALAKAFITLGHEVQIGTRTPADPKLKGLQAAAPDKAVQFGEVVVLATAWSGTENAIRLAGAKNLAGKVVIDATNPLKQIPGGVTLAVAGNDSAGEQVQRWLPGAKVVKAFNIVGNALMFRPQLAGGPPDMFIAGNDAGAKSKVTEILQAFGWNVIDSGSIESARYLEALAMLWIIYGFSSKTWNHAFKLLRQ